MGPGHTPGHPRQPDNFSSANLRPLFHSELGKMKVHGVKSTAMIQKNTLAAIKEISDERDPTVICSLNFGFHRHSEIDAGVRRPRDTVNDPAVAKRRADIG